MPSAGRPADPGPAAPSALATYVDEPFYAPLAVRLEQNNLDDALASRLQNYRSSKLALLAELRARLDTLRDVDPTTRELALAGLAREQTPPIAELESTAEQLRRDLAAGLSARPDDAGGPASAEILGAPAGPALKGEYRAVQAAIFYTEGLSPEQRRLLREVAVELAGRARPAPAGPAIFFSPAPARIILPSPLPPDLAAKVDAYRRENDALKTALLVALFGSDRSADGAARTAALATLAAAQAPRFAALESLAEEIRRGLATLRDPALSPEMPDLPPELAARIAAYRAQKFALERQLEIVVDQARRVRPQPGVERIVAERIRFAIAAFMQRNAAIYAWLEQNKESIRADVAKLSGASSAGGSSADALEAKFSDSLRQVETSWDYRDYQTAALQPGLSPEQRRLLFEGALEKLALPLPAGQGPPG
jgi:hypothetical protein